MVGSLIFLTRCTRFDIAFSTMQSARLMAKPTTVHMAGVKRILRCLRGTPDLPLIYKRDSSFDQVGYCGSSCGLGDPEKLRSVTGSMFFIARGLVHFSSQLQKIISRRTTESEIIAINTCAKQGVLSKRVTRRGGLEALRDLQDFIGQQGRSPPCC